MKLGLEVLSEGRASGQTIPITLSQFIIGRDPQCHLRPASPIISKRHCAIIVQKGKVLIHDFKSTNGTFLNEEPVEGQMQLSDGDILKVGPIRFRVHIEATVAVDKPTPLPANRGKESNDEDDMAAMLLMDEAGTTTPASDDSEEEIPSGTTMMDIPTFGMEAEAAEAKAKAEAEKEEAEKEKKSAPANTASAAAEILAKYARRNRT